MWRKQRPLPQAGLDTGSFLQSPQIGGAAQPRGPSSALGARSRLLNIRQTHQSELRAEIRREAQRRPGPSRGHEFAGSGALCGGPRALACPPDWSPEFRAVASLAAYRTGREGLPEELTSVSLCRTSSAEAAPPLVPGRAGRAWKQGPSRCLSGTEDRLRDLLWVLPWPHRFLEGPQAPP